MQFDTSVNLSLPYIMEGQAQKHVTHNEAIRILDAIVQPVVVEAPRTAPPAKPEPGERYVIAPGATGDWAGHDGEIAFRTDSYWTFIAPRAGWAMRLASNGSALVFDGTGWRADALPSRIDRLGIGASADDENRLAVASDATLLDNAGAGHQVKVNKAKAANTASLLFQTGFSGRAEMGTAGDDAFAIKVSADGVAWHEALRTDPRTGAISFPSGVRTPGRLNLADRVLARTDKKWVALSTVHEAATEPAGASGGTGNLPDLSWRQSGPFLAAGTTLKQILGHMRPIGPTVTGLDLAVFAQYGSASGDWSSNATTVRDLLHRGTVALAGGWTRIAIDLAAYTVPRDGCLLISARAVGGENGKAAVYSSLQVEWLAPSAPV